MLHLRWVIDNSLEWHWRTRQLHLNSWQKVGALVQVCHYLLQQFVSFSCIVDSMIELLCTRFPLSKTMGACRYNGYVDMDTSVLFGNKLYFTSNTSLMWVTEMAASAIDTEPINGTFWNRLPTWYLTKDKCGGLRRYWISWTILEPKNCR